MSEPTTPPNPSAVEWQKQFLEYLAGERNYSSHTIEAYKRSIAQFDQSLPADLLAATPNDVNSFMAELLSSGISTHSAALKFHAIRSFYKFVSSEGGLPRNPTRNLRPPKSQQTLVRATTGKEIDEMLAAQGTDTALEMRDKALLYVAYGSGLRVSELVNLRTADLDLTHGIAKVRQGKGRKDRLTPMNQQEMDAISLWLEKGRGKFVREPDNGLVFIGRGGEPLTRQRIYQVLGEISESVLGRRVSPHKFRHAFVTESVHGGADIRVVQHMAGHADVNTTMRYLHSDPERIRTEYLKAHPRGAEPCNKQSTGS